MSSGVDAAEAARGNAVGLDNHVRSEPVKSDVHAPVDNEKISSESLSANDSSALRGPNGEEYPTAEELNTLERVKGPITWIIYTIAFIELCERFAYYGTTAVFVNFISEPMPPGSTTGAAGYGQAGALGFSQQASTGLTLFNSFWAYLMPLFGGYFADSYWGKYKTIHIAIAIAMFGHIIIIVSALPPVMTNPSGALGCFCVGLIFFGIGVGFFKANISPMIAEQYEASQPRPVVKTLADGRRVIVDPVLTISVIYMRYYFFINVGAVVGQVSMVYAEKYVGFWLAYTLPTILFIICPMVLIAFKSKYVRTPPTGSVLGKASGLFFLAIKKSNGKIRSGNGFWDRVKPSNIPENERPAWMTFDDAWVEEVRRGFKACLVFIWLPVWWLAYNQLNNNLISQAATMRLDGVPNDIITNLNPISLVIFIPIVDNFLYPALRKAGIKFTPIKRIAFGFLLASLAMVGAAVIQHYIYATGECGKYMNSCDTFAPVNVWTQAVPYVLVGFSEIFTSITGLEFAFTKAPKNMRSLVTSYWHFMSAFSNALGQAFVSLSEDPLLVWNYTTVAILAFIGGVLFWFHQRPTDKQEDSLNMLPDSTYMGKDRRHSVAEESARHA